MVIGTSLPNFVQIVPEFHCARIRTEFREICAQEHLSVQNLRTVVV